MEEIDGGENADGLQRMPEQLETDDGDKDDQLGLEEVERHVEAFETGILEDEADFGDATPTNQLGERDLPTEHLDRAQT